MSWEQEVVAEKMAFMMCDSDKMVGLTWREVESCIQRYAGLLEDNRASNEPSRILKCYSYRTPTSPTLSLMTFVSESQFHGFLPGEDPSRPFANV